MAVAEEDAPGGALEDEPHVGVEGVGHAREAAVDLPHLVHRQTRLLDATRVAADGKRKSFCKRAERRIC